MKEGALIGVDPLDTSYLSPVACYHIILEGYSVGYSVDLI